MALEPANWYPTEGHLMASDRSKRALTSHYTFPIHKILHILLHTFKGPQFQKGNPWEHIPHGSKRRTPVDWDRQ